MRGQEQKAALSQLDRSLPAPEFGNGHTHKKRIRKFLITQLATKYTGIQIST